MGSASESLEGGLELFAELLAEDPRLEREFAESRSQFAASLPADREEQRLAARRHLEWFVLERPSESLGGVPVEVLQGAWLARADAGQRALGPSFLESLAGAFEVTQAVPEEGVWVRDLFSLGEFPVDEPEAATDLRQGDVVVGRLFPIGDGAFRFSPAAACFRDARLLEAVREDLDRMRRARRGVLRVQQIELEQLFFGGTERPRISSSAEARESARKLLEAGGVERARTDEILEVIERASERGDGGVVTEVLNELAFETDLDLESARRVLVDLWSCLAAPSAPDGGSGVQDARAALEAFDRGRAAGQDLEQLFRVLERDLGVAPAAELEEDHDPEAESELPVIAGLVEEFLWDVGREHGAARAERWNGLRRLGRYARAISVFEDLGPRELLDFAGRWLLDEGELEGPAQAGEVLDALGAFCRWAEENQGHPLWREFGTDLDGLRASVPRLLALSLSGAAPANGAPLLRIHGVDADAVWLERPDGEQTRQVLPRSVLEHLRVGDIIRLSDAGRQARLTAAYPREIEDLLRAEP